MGCLSRFLPPRTTCTQTPQWWGGEHMWAPSQPPATGRSTWCPVTSTFWNWRPFSRHSNSFTTLWQAGQSSSTRTTRPWHATSTSRGSLFSAALTENGGTSSVVRQPVHPVVSPVCSGQVEHSGRPSQLTTHGLAVGMDSCALSAQANLVSLVHTSHRPLCHSFSHRLPVYVSQVPDLAAWAVDALSIPWSNLLSYAFPLIPIIGKVLRKARDERATLILVAPHWPAQAWFPELLHLCHVPPIRLLLGSSSVQVGGSARKPRGVASSRLASVRDLLSSLNASSSVFHLVEHAHHPGTQGMYSAHWDGWVKWCVDHSVRPHNPSSCDLANILAFLSCDKGLSASLVKVHRSAVCTTIHQMGGPTSSDDPLLWDLVRGAALAEAKSSRRIPSWDLFLVPSALFLAPMSHISSPVWSTSLLRRPSWSFCLWQEMQRDSRTEWAPQWRGIWARWLHVSAVTARFLGQIPASRLPFSCHLYQVPLLYLSSRWWGPFALPCQSFASLQEAHGVLLLQVTLPASLLERELQGWFQLLMRGPGQICLSSPQGPMR